MPIYRYIITPLKRGDEVGDYNNNNDGIINNSNTIIL